jgi:GWxTD domain-containing protein
MFSSSRSHHARRSQWTEVCSASLIVFIALAGSYLGAADKGLDKAAEKWLREVHLLILPEEEGLFRALLTTEDRKEFQRIFWARRDPDPSTPKNEMEEALVKGRSRADDLFTSPNERGGETGCGQVFLLLGDPLEVQGIEQRGTQGRGAREKFDSLQPMRDGARPPEVWVYRSKAGDPVGFTGGELRIPFDDACRFSEGGRILDDLRLIARSRVVRPALDYRTSADGHLVPLEALLKAQSASGSAPIAGATDFPVALEPKLLLRTQTGVAYAAGLVRADLAAAKVASGPGPVTGVVSAEATPVSGPAIKAQRAFSATAAADGSLIASYGLPLKPGQYALRIGVSLSGGKSSSATVPLEVPDFEAPGLHVAPLVLYPDEPSSPADPKDPYSALTVGSLRLRPRFGDAFKVSDALQVVSVLSGGKTDPATGKASLHARFTVMKDGKQVAKGDDQAFETSNAVASIGPVPLAGYSLGRYVVRLEVKDGAAGTSVTEERPFEIKE